MRIIIIAAYFVLMFFTSNGQKIEQTSFDKFDSVIKIKTTTEYLSPKKSKKEKELQVSIISNYILSHQYKPLKQNDAVIFLVFYPKETGSLGDDSKIKFLYTDNSVEEYSYKGKYHIISSDESSVFYFDINFDSSNKIFTSEIASIRISYSEGNQDYELPPEKKSIVKDALNLTKLELEKIPK